MTTTTVVEMRLDGWTVDDLASLPDELRCELVDGGLLLSPPPLVRPAYAVGRLHLALHASAVEPWVALPGGGLRFDAGNDRVPDVLVVRRSALARRSSHPTTWSSRSRS